MKTQPSITMKTFDNRSSSSSFHLRLRQSSVAPISKPAVSPALKKAGCCLFQRAEPKAHSGRRWNCVIRQIRKSALPALGAALLLALPVRAAEFHVATVLELATALTTAADNGMDNTIYLNTNVVEG